jgi:hypothetical protein
LLGVGHSTPGSRIAAACPKADTGKGRHAQQKPHRQGMAGCEAAGAMTSSLRVKKPSTQRHPAEGPMRDDDLHLPEACVGAFAVLVLLVAAFLSTPASAAAVCEPPACATGARPAH